MKQHALLDLTHAIENQPQDRFPLDAAVSRLLKLPADEELYLPLQDPDAARAVADLIFPSAKLTVWQDGNQIVAHFHPAGWKAPVRRRHPNEAAAICMCVLCARYLEIEDVRLLHA
jgi:hypothetical protein